MSYTCLSHAMKVISVYYIALINNIVVQQSREPIVYQRSYIQLNIINMFSFPHKWYTQILYVCIPRYKTTKPSFLVLKFSKIMYHNPPPYIDAINFSLGY